LTVQEEEQRFDESHQLIGADVFRVKIEQEEEEEDKYNGSDLEDSDADNDSEEGNISDAGNCVHISLSHAHF